MTAPGLPSEVALPVLEREAVARFLYDAYSTALRALAADNKPFIGSLKSYDDTVELIRGNYRVMADAVLTLVTAARRAAVEEAAKVCDDFEKGCRETAAANEPLAPIYDGARYLAKALRALLSPAAGRPGGA